MGVFLYPLNMGLPSSTITQQVASHVCPCLTAQGVCHWDKEYQCLFFKTAPLERKIPLYPCGCCPFFFQFPEHPYGDLLDKVLLYRHSSNDNLVAMEANDTIEDGTIIEIVLKGEWRWGRNGWGPRQKDE